jgi:hypothetical protein
LKGRKLILIVVYLVFLVSTEVANAIFFEQFVVVLFGQLLSPGGSFFLRPQEPVVLPDDVNVPFVIGPGNEEI